MADPERVEGDTTLHNSPPRRLSLSAVAGALFSVHSDRAKVDSDKISADPLSGSITLAAVNISRTRHSPKGGAGCPRPHVGTITDRTAFSRAMRETIEVSGGPQEGARIAMEHVAAAHARLHGMAIPIYAEDARGLFSLEGSAFLLQVGTAVFLITAAHTLHAYGTSPLWVPAKGQTFPLNATFSHSRIDGIVDFAFARLDSRMDPLLEGARVFSVDELDVDDWPEPNKFYTFYGYPVTASKVDTRKKTLTHAALPYSSHLPLPLEAYDAHGLSPAAAIAVYFNLKKAEEEGTGRIVQPKNPVGISGGPVVRIGSYAELATGPATEKVIGLGVEFQRNPDMLLGARIALVMEGLRAKHPDLAEFIPVPTRYKVNVSQA